MITSMHIENFKCFKAFDINLGPFNVLIGPNDSGKTSLLESVLLVSALVFGAKLNPSHILDRVGVRVGAGTLYQGPRENDDILIRLRHRPAGTD
ncbi:MAG TPA: AAA family ATPase, partial [Phycisphaerae bacterium]|nr:AAA family ATPase [Phycisphaerae bacterium]